MRVELGDDIREVSVPLSEHPGPFVFLEYAKPGITPAMPLIPSTPVVKRRLLHMPKRTSAFAAKHGARAIRLPHPDPIKFAQVLAKIAYAFSVGSTGLDRNLGAAVLPAILSGSADIFRFVGNDPDLGPFTDAAGMYSIAVTNTDTDRIAFVRLLGLFGAPEYVIHLDAPAAG